MKNSTPKLITLRESLNRARETSHGIKEKSYTSLMTELFENNVRCFCRKITVWESHHCWVFPEQKGIIHHKALSLLQKETSSNHELTIAWEKEAWALAYSERKLNDNSTYKLPFEGSILVFTGMEKTRELSGEEYPVQMRGALEIEISDNKKNLEIMTYNKWPYEQDLCSRYWSNSVLQRIFAEDVSCLRSDIDEVFPYSANNPTRAERGRPSAQDQIYSLLNEIYPSIETLPSNAEIKDKLLDKLALKGMSLADSTCFKHIKNWLTARHSVK